MNRNVIKLRIALRSSNRASVFISRAEYDTMLTEDDFYGLVEKEFGAQLIMIQPDKDKVELVFCSLTPKPC